MKVLKYLCIGIILCMFASVLAGCGKSVSSEDIEAALELNNETVPIIETLEILQDYRHIEDINTAAMAAYLNRFAELYSDEAADQVLERVKYKKSTIAFMEAILNHMGIRNSLGKYLSPMSDYKIPRLEAIYALA